MFVINKMVYLMCVSLFVHQIVQTEGSLLVGVCRDEYL